MNCKRKKKSSRNQYRQRKNLSQLAVYCILAVFYHLQKDKYQNKWTQLQVRNISYNTSSILNRSNLASFFFEKHFTFSYSIYNLLYRSTQVLMLLFEKLFKSVKSKIMFVVRNLLLSCRVCRQHMKSCSRMGRALAKFSSEIWSVISADYIDSGSALYKMLCRAGFEAGNSDGRYKQNMCLQAI